MRKKLILILLIGILWGCSSISKTYQLGYQEALNQNWDEAIKYYEQATLEDPTNSYYRLALMRAKIIASNTHLYEARRLADRGEKEAALAEYDLALAYDPNNQMIINEARRMMQPEKKEVKTLTSEFEPPVKLDIKEDAIALRFPREVSLRSIFLALAKYSEVNVIFDEGFRDKPFAIDLTDMTFEQAINTLCMATKNFYRIVDPKTVLIVADTPQNRMKYDLTAVKTFYLSNIQAQEAQQWLLQMIRSAQKIPTITHNKELNTVTIKDSPDKLILAEKMIKLWDKAKGEIVIGLEIMEIRRQKLRDMGLELDNYSVGLSYTGDSETGWHNLGNIDLGNSENYSISIPNAFLRFLETDVDTKLIAQPQLRGVHGEKIEYMVGDEVPIPNTTFAPVAAGGVPSQPIVNYDYKNVGIEIGITPQIHSEDEVTLELDLQIRAIAGSGIGDLPVITTRQVKNVLRLKDGETNLLAGMLKDQERRVVKGIPGIKEIPGLGSLFSYTDEEIEQTDVIMTITPYIIRSIALEESDYAPVWLPLEGISSGGAARSQRLPVPPGMEQEDMVDVFEEERRPSGANRIALSPPGFETAMGRDIRVNVNISCQEEVQNMSLTISYNAQVLNLKSLNRGNVIQRMGENPSFLENIDNSSGTCVVGFSASTPTTGFKGAGNIVTLLFEAVEAGESTVVISGFSAISVSGRPIQFSTSESRIKIRE